MPITINGSGTITGISVGGLPDGIVDADMLAAGAVVQVVNTSTGAHATGTTTMPADDTIPQNTEGDEYMTLAITPTSTSSKLLITVNAALTRSTGAWITAALFQDSTANAIAVAANYDNVSGSMEFFSFNHYMTAGTTSATTFKLRAGLHTSGTTHFNGFSISDTRGFGGVLASSITITEIAA